MRVFLSGGFCGFCIDSANEPDGVGRRKGGGAKQIKRFGSGTDFALAFFDIGLARDSLGIYDVRVESFRKFDNGERAAECRMEAAAEGKDLQRHVGPGGY